MTKIKLLIILIPLIAQANFLESVFLDEYLEIERISFEELIKKNQNIVENHKKSQLTEKILKDYKKRISSKFKIDPYFRDKVRFWFTIYTTYTSDFVVIHDTEKINIIYNVLDFNFLKTSGLDRYQKANIQTRYTQNFIKTLKKSLVRAGSEKKPSFTSKKLIETITKAGYKPPKGRAARKKYFKGLASRVRAQTGQRDMIQTGLINESVVDANIQRFLKIMRLPKELIALPFLESSFNPYAYSKVGAAGAWQFMRRTGRYFMRVDKEIDYRRNPVVSSVAGLQLLKQNRGVTKRWDLAVSAYNNGTKHIRIAQKKLRGKLKRSMSLADMFKYYHSDHIGFASKSFYPSFLALTRVLSYRENLFKNLDTSESKKDIKVYISKCKIRPTKYINFKDTLENYLNLHFRNRNKIYPRGTIVVSTKPLSSKKFLALTDRQMVRAYPNKWVKYLKKHKCPK